MERAFANPSLLAALLLLGLTGCGRTPAELRLRALDGEAAARQAFEQHEPEAADQAASRAEAASARLEEQINSGKVQGPENEAFRQDARAAAGSARNYAQLADEERQCRSRLASLKLKAYRRARAALCEYGFSGLAPAAEHFGHTGAGSVSPAEQQVASLAWSVVQVVEQSPPMTNGLPDWARVAADLRFWSTNPPPGIGMFLSAAFAAHGLTDFALSEIESVDPASLAATNARALYHLERSVLFAAHGWDRTAARELDHALRFAPENLSGFGGTQAVALVHLWRAGAALQRKDLPTADLELGAALKTWPDNPVAALITAESMAAHGEWAKAADLLEARAGDTHQAWLAERLARRAREIRDAKGSAPPLFSDPASVLDLASHLLSSTARDSAPAQWFQGFLSDAKAFGQRVLSQLPRSDGGG